MHGRDALFILALSVLSSAARAQQYTVTDIGNLGGQFTEGFAINDSNQVTGVCKPADRQRHFCQSTPSSTQMEPCSTWGCAV